jgi:hypothetical protein
MRMWRPGWIGTSNCIDVIVSIQYPTSDDQLFSWLSGVKFQDAITDFHLNDEALGFDHWVLLPENDFEI